MNILDAINIITSSDPEVTVSNEQIFQGGILTGNLN